MFKLENKTNGRYYYIFLENDLFGEYILVVYRGSVRRHFNPIRVLLGDKDKIDRKANQLAKIRISRGYTLIID